MRPAEIRRLRTDLGISQEKFAKAFGVSFATISRWESGKAEPSTDQEQQLEALRELVSGRGIDKKKVRRVLAVAGVQGAVTAAALAGVGLVTPLGAAIGALLGGGVVVSALASLFKKDEAGKATRSRK